MKFGKGQPTFGKDICIQMGENVQNKFEKCKIFYTFFLKSYFLKKGLQIDQIWCTHISRIVSCKEVVKISETCNL